MRVILVLFLVACLFLKETQQFTFPKLELGKLEEDLKKTGRKILDKFTFVNWIVEKVKSMTNTKKDVTGMVSDAVDTYW
jgi:hypothetical protein